MMRIILTILLLLTCTSMVTPMAISQIQNVEVMNGKLEGVVTDDITSFKGIPFAAPPVGDLRWREPQPVKGWTGIRKADAFAPGCMQDPGLAKMMGASEDVSEDCLYLNVWTPAKTEDEKIPVIFYIHGGGFTNGMTSIPTYDGTRLAQKGAVAVSSGYRLGPFGFLAHRDLSAESEKGSGNYGLQDLIAALQWVKKNISQFGGDESRVTLFGHSAGGMAVNLLSVSPAADGLYHRTICMSGGLFVPLPFPHEAGQRIPTLEWAETQGADFLKKLGVSHIEAARALSTEQIQKASPVGIAGQFWPVLDGEILPRDSYEMYRKSRFNDTPMLVGATSDEAATLGPIPVTKDQFEKSIRAEYGAHADAILKAYPHSNDAEATRAMKGVIREVSVSWPTWTWARLQSQQGKGNVYMYWFHYHTPDTPDGAAHGTDIPFPFQTVDHAFRIFDGQNSPPREALVLSDMMSSYWINFAESGDPNGSGLTEWPVFTEDDPKAMFLGSVSDARPLPNIEGLKAFDEYYSYHRKQASRGNE